MLGCEVPMILRCCSLITIIFLFSCGQVAAPVDAPVNADTVVQATTPAFKIIQKDTTLIISGVEVDILVPARPKADMLVLPGWNYSRKMAFGAAPLTQVLLDKGYRLIIPEMGKSIYASQYFPESRKDWVKYPTLTWLTDTMITALQNEYGMLREGEKNFISGISTGARGVVLVAARRPIFTAGAALSGDYDQTMQPGDNLMKGVYGEYEKFKARWETVDNPSQQVDKMNMPLYLGHGEKDRVVPASQAKSYYEKLHAAKPHLEIVLHIAENGGHYPVYWLSEMERVLTFFEERSK